MPAPPPLNIFESEAVLAFLKIAILIILAFYTIFALLVIRQVDLMRKTIISSASEVLSALSIIHAGFAIGLIILAYIIL